MNYYVLAQHVRHDNSDHLYIILNTLWKEDHYNCIDAVFRNCLLNIYSEIKIKEIGKYVSSAHELDK